MMNKKGQEMSVGTLLLLVLGVVVVVLVILGFSLGWNTIFEKFKIAPSNVQALAKVCPTYADELSVDFCAWREIEGTGKFINCKDSRMGAIETTTVCNSGEKACAELAKAGNDVTKITINGVPCPAMDCTTKLGGVAVASADCVAPRVTLKGATGLAAGQVCCTPAAA